MNGRWFHRRCTWCQGIIPDDAAGTRGSAVPWPDGVVLPERSRMIIRELDDRVVFGYFLGPEFAEFPEWPPMRDAGAAVLFPVCSDDCEWSLDAALARASDKHRPH